MVVCFLCSSLQGFLVPVRLRLLIQLPSPPLLAQPSRQCPPHGEVHISTTTPKLRPSSANWWASRMTRQSRRKRRRVQRVKMWWRNRRRCSVDWTRSTSLRAWPHIHTEASGSASPHMSTTINPNSSNRETLYIDGLMQERCNSSVLAMELHLSCTDLSI